MLNKIKNEFKAKDIKFKFSDRRVDGNFELYAKLPTYATFKRYGKWEDPRVKAEVEAQLTGDYTDADIHRAAAQVATTYDRSKKVNVYPKSRSR